MYRKLPNLVLGFHGCNRNTFENVLYKQESLKQSENSYDWLGHGIYFWEQNFARAEDWAKKRYGEDEARVIGAVIDLGCCLNLTDSFAAALLKQGYALLKFRCDITGINMPHNRPSTKTNDVLLRDLDCAVIQQIHDYARHMASQGKMLEFDSVRGVFVEGEAPYSGSDFREKTHIQLCVRNPNCIKGYFNPRMPDKKCTMP